MTTRRIIPREAALADFDNIYDRLAPGLRSEADQPRLGRPYEHRGHSLRVLTHGDYRVFYREQAGEIDLLRVIDARRNIPDVLDELDGLL